jgi:hypothetical protein
LLGACNSYPILHGKIDEMHAYIVSLEAKLKNLFSLLVLLVKCML